MNLYVEAHLTSFFPLTNLLVMRNTPASFEFSLIFDFLYSDGKNQNYGDYVHLAFLQITDDGRHFMPLKARSQPC